MSTNLLVLTLYRTLVWREKKVGGHVSGDDDDTRGSLDHLFTSNWRNVFREDG